MKPLDRASGDVLADRRADYAEMLFRAGDREAAAALMLDALELAPGWALGWFRLGEMAEAAGAIDQATAAWRMVLELDAADRPGAALKLELIGAAPRSSGPPVPFVEALFDHYAETFDEALVGKLGYRVPELLEAAIRATGRFFARAVDLGCGTGLMGERVRPMVGHLEGIDISAAMLRKAEARGCYDRLVRADLNTMEFPGADLFTAADVFMYVGALDRVLAGIAAAIAQDGILAFTVESHDGPEPFRLNASRRYAHSEPELRHTLERAGLTVAGLQSETIRMDRGEPVTGLVVVARLR